MYLFITGCFHAIEDDVACQLACRVKSFVSTYKLGLYVEAIVRRVRILVCEDKFSIRVISQLSRFVEHSSNQRKGIGELWPLKFVPDKPRSTPWT